VSNITIDRLSFAYDGAREPVFEDLSLRLDTDWKLGLVGRNGRGKTTLLRILAGELEHRGTVITPARCRRFPCPVEHPEGSVAQVLTEIAPEAQPWQLERELSLLGLGEEYLSRAFSTLSGGERSRVLLCALFVDQGSYPMLDEPTDHLDARGREQVADYLSRSRRGFLLVSHDRDFLDRCADHILALNRTGQEVVKGNFSVWYAAKRDRDELERRQNQELRREIGRLEESARARKQKADAVERSKHGATESGLRPYLGEKSRKGQRQRKNLERRQQRAVEEKSALLKDVERADALKLAPAVFHSRRLLEVRDVSIFYDGEPVCQEISFTLNQGDRLCLSGGNGSGKTSLLRLILGEEVPHTGRVWVAPGLEVSYVPQRTDGLHGALLDLPEQRGLDPTLFLTVLRKLDFPREMFQADMASYSSGQKKKVLLAASLCRSAHLYIWDEPLNFVDLFSRIQLEELILSCQPTLLFVEHDRAFQNRAATAWVEL